MYNGFSGLEPWTLYNVRVALYTSLAVNGTGPWSDWQLVQTLQAGEVHSVGFCRIYNACNVFQYTCIIVFDSFSLL